MAPSVKSLVPYGLRRCLGESGYGGFTGLGVWREAEFPQSARGDRTYGDAEGVFGKCDSRGFAEGQQVTGSGGAGEGDGCRRSCLRSEQLLEQMDGGGRNDGAVGGGYGHFGTMGAKGFGEELAGFFGSDEEKSGRFTIRLPSVGEQG